MMFLLHIVRLLFGLLLCISVLSVTTVSSFTSTIRKSISPSTVTTSSRRRALSSSTSQRRSIPHNLPSPHQRQRQHSKNSYHISLYRGIKFSQSFSSTSSSSETSSTASTSSTSVPNSNESQQLQPPKRMLYPAVGDIVRYYDLDGGNTKGQMMIGKIAYISKNMGDEKSGWTIEIIALDPIGDETTITSTTGSIGGNTDTGGLYYADYPSYQKRRQSKTVLRDLLHISPVTAIFVNNKNAYRISIDKVSQQPLVRQELYDIVGYEGPFSTTSNSPYTSNLRPINSNIVEDDLLRYDQLKTQLFTNTIAFGSVVSVLILSVCSFPHNIVDTSTAGNEYELTDGYDIAIIYFSGVLASLLYLYFLSMKTDTMATTTTNNKFGKIITNLRFITPVLPLICVSLYNQIIHSTDFQSTTFKLVSTKQFFAATTGFLSYRIPLFYTQIQEALNDDLDKVTSSTSSSSLSSTTSSMKYQPIDSTTTTTTTTSTPGKVSLVSTMETTSSNIIATTNVDITQSSQLMRPLFPIKFNSLTKQNELVTIFLISGPSATGRSDLVQRFVEESNGRFVLPNYIDRYNNATQYEYIDQQRDGFIYKSNDDRYGLTRETLIQDVQKLDPKKSVLLLDTDVDFAVQLAKIGGGSIRLVAVWVTLGSITAFEERIGQEYDQQTKRITDIMPDEGRNTEIRARTMKIVQDIELGISSGIFEFTIINGNEEQSLKELRDASKYCFV